MSDNKPIIMVFPGCPGGDHLMYEKHSGFLSEVANLFYFDPRDCGRSERDRSFSIDKIIEYALLLKNETTTARVGYLLESLQKDLHVDDKQLSLLEKHCPKNANYFDDGNKNKCDGSLVKRWNLIVSDEIHHRLWEEF